MDEVPSGLSKKAQASGKSRAVAAKTDVPIKPANLPGLTEAVREVTGHGLPLVLAIDLIDDSGRNPRQQVDQADLTRLTDSIRQYGVLQPIRVRPAAGDRYEVVFGHRRWMAAKAAKLKTMPVVVSEPSESEAFVQGLVENLQRSELDPIDEAKAFQMLLAEDPTLTQEALGKKIGRSQSYVANSQRLLETAPEVQAALHDGKLTVAHAKTLASLPIAKQAEMATAVVEQKISSGDLEYKVRVAKDDARRDADRQKAVIEAVDVHEQVLTKAKVTKDDERVVAVRTAEIAKQLQERGWKSVVVESGEMTTGPSYKCDCTALYVLDWQKKVEHMCIVPEHLKAWRKERDEATKKVAAENGKKIEAARRKTAAAMKSDSGLSIDGLRLTLYVLLTRLSNGSMGRQGEMAEGFVKRHGGEWPDRVYGDWSLVWETVEALDVTELADEIAKAIAPRLTPNVYSESEYSQKLDAGVRQWLVDQYGVDKSIVWGRLKPEQLATQEIAKAAAQKVPSESPVSDEDGEPAAVGESQD